MVVCVVCVVLCVLCVVCVLGFVRVLCFFSVFVHVDVSVVDHGVFFFLLSSGGWGKKML